MKKFLFISWDGLISDIAWQVLKEGNKVKLYIKAESQKDIGLGFVERTNDWQKEIDWADVIVFDDVLGQGELAQKLRQKGRLAVGGTAYTDKLEDDRSFGQEELRASGINIIPYKNFRSFDEAIDFVRSNPGRYVIKPSGEAQNIKRLLFIGEEETGQDILAILHAYKKSWKNQIKEFQIQKRIMGVEIAVGAFFNGKEFIYPININFEHKRFFPGNLGPLTGEMGTSMYWSMPNKIFNNTLKRIESKLAEERYVGYIDLNCIVNSNGIYPLEWTSRFGYPTIFIQKDGILMPISELFYRLARGESFTFKYKKGFQVGIRVLLPPYPFNDPSTFDAYSKNAAIVFKKPNGSDGVYIEDVKKIDEQWQVAGDTGVVLTVTGCGMTMKQAQQQAYQRVKNILIPNMYYRKDIGDRWFEDSDKLHNWGYLREL